jgi:hypothetical protein
LQVADLVNPSLVTRRNVVHFQSALVCGDAAKLATELGFLKDFITQGPTDVASASPTVFSSLTALGDILCELPVANGLQFLHLLCGKTVVFQLAAVLIKERTSDVPDAGSTISFQ